jgi:hypothetical protein
MNERIKELASKNERIWNLYTIGPVQRAEVEQFVESIVNECADICSQQGRVGWNDDRKAQARLDSDLIKQHFRVEL